ncbi:Bax inhibitor-1/YccA family protein [Cryomorpha ignava]|uniref:Bax inhibitor-1/YccA family protein n=1 Tax=Cryomorpha ignava TaxID=101383 RepID=A0A7K3WV30_9FLAO|nr:Bax inhibitor-1/YccA family protein [Cryomorpha ignava]NEN25539.1 Bax inhibitor-1/YccA family protein [Cryomorpha ignava]
MENDKYTVGWHTQDATANLADSGTLVKSFVSNVMTYMASALAISGVMAYWFGTNESLMEMLRNLDGSLNMIGWIVMLAPFGLVLLMGFGFKKLSSTAMLTVFVIYAVLMGMSLSFIFLAYTSATIYTTFFITAGTFGLMAFLGYTTSTDLTKMGSILYMALIGLILAMVVNWFMNSAVMDYVISGIGVLIFTGLTAYDMQKIKHIGMVTDSKTEEGTKLALMGALNLYLDFVNLFLFLLRFLGNRN